jgi:hypothetical protein
MKQFTINISKTIIAQMSKVESSYSRNKKGNKKKANNSPQLNNNNNINKKNNNHIKITNQSITNK